MEPQARIGAVVLAAGNARRFGSLKQLVVIGGEPIVRRTVRQVLTADFNPVVVVVGAQAARVSECLQALNVRLAVSQDWKRGLGHSIASGVKALMEATGTLDAMLIMLADQPRVTTGDLERMRRAYAVSPDSVLASEHEGLTGPPCIFPLRLADELLALQGASGARDLLKRQRSEVIGFPLPAAFVDVDTREDYEALLVASDLGDSSPLR